MQRLAITQPAGRKKWQDVLARQTGSADPLRIRQDERTILAFGKPVSAREAVACILRDVRDQGDPALVRYARLLDGISTTAKGLRVKDQELNRAVGQVPEVLKKALRQAGRNITVFHKKQLYPSQGPVLRSGVRLQEQWLPLERVGIYVPGGNAPLISTVLMNALPARVAGVREIVMATPPARDGKVPAALLFAAELAGIREIYSLGGAAGIAALALGTKTIRPVSKVVGPGNVFVTEAKRQLFGEVGIDHLAGPSEILIIADTSSRPDWLVWDLLAQSEHGSGAVSVLLSPSEALLAEVEAAAARLIQSHPEKASALQSAYLVKTASLEEAIYLANQYAPEHLSLQVKQPRILLGKIRQAGAVFLGSATAQAMGDYVAGSNHVLPTGRTAGWASALSVRDFIHHFSVVEYTGQGMRQEGPAAIAIAQAEGLEGHAESIRQRIVQGTKNKRGLA
jgi:histidinol dehydrogenase